MTRPTGLTRREQVTEAAKMMDTEVPGWFNLITIEDFKIQSCANCVLGQVFGQKMEDKLRKILGDATPMMSAFPDPRSGWVVGYGFMQRRGYVSDGKYAHLTGNAFAGEDINCFWKEEIISRQVEAAEGGTPDTTPSITENHD